MCSKTKVIAPPPTRVRPGTGGGSLLPEERPRMMSLQTMVRQVGKEVVEKKLEDFEDEVKRLRTQAIKDALEDSSSDDDEDR